MDFTGINLVDKPKIIKILQAVQSRELDSMYHALRATDENLRQSFVRFLLFNPLGGCDLAINKLQTVVNPEAAVRAAAVCLLAVRMETND